MNNKNKNKNKNKKIVFGKGDHRNYKFQNNDYKLIANLANSTSFS